MLHPYPYVSPKFGRTPGVGKLYSMLASFMKKDTTPPTLVPRSLCSGWSYLPIPIRKSFY